MGIAGWRWLFIIEGVITIGVAIAAGFILPDYPATTKWLNEEERNFASWRLMADINESDDTHLQSIWDGVKLCLTDYRLYLFVLTQHLRSSTSFRPLCRRWDMERSRLSCLPYLVCYFNIAPPYIDKTNPLSQSGSQPSLSPLP